MMNLNEAQEKFLVDIGQADIYTGVQYQYPYFFEFAGKKMMKDMSINTIDFKTWAGEYFQCSLDTFHSHTCLLITSTLEDCVFFPAKSLDLDKAKSKAEKAINTKTEIKNSFSGYSTYGQKMLRQYELFEKHIKEQNIYFTSESLRLIFKELLRRAKEDERSAST